MPTTLGVVTEKESFPGIVLVHGGGGAAFAKWAELWAKRGYAGIAMDLAGCGERPSACQTEDQCKAMRSILAPLTVQ
jgi:dienelactone hydrolase